MSDFNSEVVLAAERFAGMTVNERLYEVGELDNFEAAVRANNIEEARRMLTMIGLPHGVEQVVKIGREHRGLPNAQD